MTSRATDLCEEIVAGRKLTQEQIGTIEQLARESVAEFVKDEAATSR